MTVTILEQVQEDVKTAMKAGERERVGQLRMLVNALQTEEKEGKGDEVAALQRERKRRLEAAEAYRDGDRPDLATAEEAEAELIQSYLPAQLSDEAVCLRMARQTKERHGRLQREACRLQEPVQPFAVDLQPFARRRQPILVIERLAADLERRT